MLPRIARVIELPDRRKLCYDEYGLPDGKPVLYFHGTPSCRIEWGLFGDQRLAERLGLRVIAVDRPGLGLSTFQPGRRIADWPVDVLALADKLDLGKFAVLSYSGGGPYAAVCAALIPERLSAVGLVSSPGPFGTPGLTDGINAANLRFLYLSRDQPWLARMALRFMGATVRYSPDRFISQAMQALPKPDQVILQNEETQRSFLGLLAETGRTGPRGAQLDCALMVSPWGFPLQDITLPVHLWHGEKDRNAAPAMARYLAGAIARGTLQVIPDEGHLSLFTNHIEEILRVLTDAGAAVHANGPS